jgi:translation initiation factor eIF-2B subunit gamma
MPHAVSIATPGLQALILCGPGSSFPTFTANPDENPKALLPIANRPMVWYPLEFCYRAGITSACPSPALSEHCCSESEQYVELGGIMFHFFAILDSDIP